MPARNPRTTQGINKPLRRYGDDWEDVAGHLWERVPAVQD